MSAPTIPGNSRIGRKLLLQAADDIRVFEEKYGAVPGCEAVLDLLLGACECPFGDDCPQGALYDFP